MQVVPKPSISLIASAAPTLSNMARLNGPGLDCSTTRMKYSISCFGRREWRLARNTLKNRGLMTSVFPVIFE